MMVRILLRPIMQLLAIIAPRPFRFIALGLQEPGAFPRPIAPRTYRDLILSKMMLPDRADRAILADKVAVRRWVEDRIGTEHLVPLLCVCDSVVDLRPDKYPFPYVVKTNHASGFNHFVRQAEDLADLPQITRDWLSQEYHSEIEWVYRDIPPKLMVEKMLTNQNGDIPSDIHFHCMFGEPVLIAANVDRHGGFHKFFFDTNWNPLEMGEIKEGRPAPPDRPECFDWMLDCVRKLSDGFDLIRVDLYDMGDRFYFSEMTNSHLGGRVAFTPPDAETRLYAEYDKRRWAYIARQRADYSAVELEKYRRPEVPD